MLCSCFWNMSLQNAIQESLVGDAAVIVIVKTTTRVITSREIVRRAVRKATENSTVLFVSTYTIAVFKLLLWSRGQQLCIQTSLPGVLQKRAIMLIGNITHRDHSAPVFNDLHTLRLLDIIKHKNLPFHNQLPPNIQWYFTPTINTQNYLTRAISLNFTIKNFVLLVEQNYDQWQYQI